MYNKFYWLFSFSNNAQGYFVNTRFYGNKVMTCLFLLVFALLYWVQKLSPTNVFNTHDDHNNYYLNIVIISRQLLVNLKFQMKVFKKKVIFT